MRQTLQSVTETRREGDYRENWRAEGLLGTVLVVPMLVGFMIAPVVMAGATAGALGLKLGERLYRAVSRFVVHRRSAASQVDRHPGPHTASGN